MKLVILDGYTLNPGDLDWDELRQYGELEIYDRTPDHLILERAAGADCIFTNKTPMRDQVLDQLENLKYIGILATGFDHVALDTARKNNVVVSNVPDYGADSVAQMVFAHILNITNNVAEHSRDVSSGGWTKQDDFCYLLSPQIELAGKTLGIIGYGEIGKATARLALAFKMKVLVNTRTRPDSLPDDVNHAALDTLLSSSDIVSLHCPLNEKTHHLINRATLGLMRKSAILINCSRGPLVHEEQLAEALNSGNIAAAGLDVLMAEPPAQDNPLLTADNCFITPHIAWATKEARTRLMHLTVDNLKAFLQGTPKNEIT